MKINEKYGMILLILFPLLLYPVPLIEFIPEIKEEDILFSIIFLYVIIYLAYLIHLILRKDKKSSTKIGRSILIIFIGIIHYVSIILIDLRENFNFTSTNINRIDWVNKRKVYLIHKKGLLKFHIGSEIGYKGLYLPLYYKYYETNNFLEFDSKSGKTIDFKEFKYTPVNDSLKLFDLRRLIRERVDIKTIRLNTDSI